MANEFERREGGKKGFTQMVIENRRFERSEALRTHRDRQVPNRDQREFLRDRQHKEINPTKPLLDSINRNDFKKGRIPTTPSEDFKRRQEIKTRKIVL